MFCSTFSVTRLGDFLTYFLINGALIIWYFLGSIKYYNFQVKNDFNIVWVFLGEIEQLFMPSSGPTVCFTPSLQILILFY